MTEVLSQSQIDSLLNSLQEGNAVEEKEEKQLEKKYRKYDFYSPKKFTKEKLKMLTGIFDNYARIVSSQINSLFRVTSEVEVVTVEEQRYYEFSNALGENDVMTLMEVTLPDHSKNPPIMLHASIPMMVNMIDRMLGSVGGANNVEDGYTYTDIEEVLYRRIMKYMIAVMKDAWSNYIRLDFEYLRIEENISMFQDIGVDETVVIIVLDVNLKEVSGRITVCVPGNLLVAIFAIMDRRKHISMEDGADDKDNRTEILRGIKESPLEVAVELGKVELDLEDVYQLNVGDIINLNKPKDSDVSVFIEGQPWFTGELGVHNRNVAVKIEEKIVDSEEAS